MEGLNEHAAAELAELRETGIEPSLDECIRFNDLARRAEYPHGGSLLPAGRPARAGSVWLWPFTIQGTAWYETAVMWFDGEGDLETYCVAYALAFGREPGAFDKLWDKRSALAAIKAWKKNLACTITEMEVAIHQVLNPPPTLPELEEDKKKKSEEDKDARASDYLAELVRDMIAMVGGDPDIWMRQVCKDWVLEQIHTICQQHAAVGDKPDGNDPKIKALTDMQRYKVYLLRKYRDG